MTTPSRPAPRGFVPPGAAAPAPKTRPRRVTLETVVRGRTVKPPRITIYGTEGAGKTTAASEAPNPIFIGVEDGTGLIDVARFPLPDDVTLDDIRDAVAELTDKPHDYKTIVLDSLDWIEQVVWRDLCTEERVSSIEKVGKGYGKGYTAAFERTKALVADLSRLRDKRDMTIVMIAHAQVKTFLNPAGDDYDRYSPKLHKATAALWCEWSDVVGFLDQETLVVEDEDTGRAKGIATGKRLLHVTHAGGWYAKNRYSMASPVVMQHGAMWDAIKAAIDAGVPRDPSEIGAAIARTVESYPEVAAEIAKYIEWAGMNPVRLEQLHQRAIALVEAAANAALEGQKEASDVG
jgi:hypothetical protein